MVRIGRRILFDERKFEKWIDDGGEALAGGWKHEPDDVHVPGEIREA